LPPRAAEHEHGRDERVHRPPPHAIRQRPEHRRKQAAQHVLAQEREAHRGERDARLVHEPDAEECHQAHARGDGDEVRRENDPDSLF